MQPTLFHPAARYTLPFLLSTQTIIRIEHTITGPPDAYQNNPRFYWLAELLTEYSSLWQWAVSFSVTGSDSVCPIVVYFGFTLISLERTRSLSMMCGFKLSVMNVYENVNLKFFCCSHARNCLTDFSFILCCFAAFFFFFVLLHSTAGVGETVLDDYTFFFLASSMCSLLGLPSGFASILLFRCEFTNTIWFGSLWLQLVDWNNLSTVPSSSSSSSHGTRLAQKRDMNEWHLAFKQQQRYVCISHDDSSIILSKCCTRNKFVWSCDHVTAFT